MAPINHIFREIELAIEFKCTRLDRCCTRSGPRLRGLVDDAHIDPKLGQPKRQNKAGWAGSNNQNVAHCHDDTFSYWFAGSEHASRLGGSASFNIRIRTGEPLSNEYIYSKIALATLPEKARWCLHHWIFRLATPALAPMSHHNAPTF